MKTIKDYLGVIVICFILTLINVIWIMNYDRQDLVKDLNNKQKYVLKY